MSQLAAIPLEPRPTSYTPRLRQAALGQFFTPPPIARFMAGLFSVPEGPVTLLDAGAGEGGLTTAFVDRWQDVAPIRADAYEIDGEVAPRLENNLAGIATDQVAPRALLTDFLADAATMIRLERGLRYNRAILNPPYRKIATSSRERRLAAAVGLETVNLYSAFVGLALDLLQEGGELVAIIPRSFCNGPYYRPFRQWLFARAALRQIHLFGSRRDAFSGDGVLQENVIVHLVRGGAQGAVTVSTSTGADFADLSAREWPFARIVEPGDPDQVIHVPTDADAEADDAHVHSTLDDLGLTVATGPVVDFRLRDHLRPQMGEGDVPLLYPQHLRAGQLVWPLGGKKADAIQRNPATEKWLVPNGWYVIVKRFSSKEERRRVVATLCDPALLPADVIGLDNKLNLIRCGKQPLPEQIARGLSVYLNSTSVDDAFRLFSGHTQVNASDLRRMRFPTLPQIEAIGRAAQDRPPVTQDDIDACVARVVEA